MVLLCTATVSFAKGVSGKIALDLTQYEEEQWIASISNVKADGITLAENGATAYTIVYPESAETPVMKAVSTLADVLFEMTGAKFYTKSDSTLQSECELVIGQTSRLTDFVGEKIEGTDGYTIKTQGQRLYIAGNSALGTANGVYSFLEDYLGVMWVSDTETYIPKTATVSLEPIHKDDIPATAWRNVYCYETAANHWAAKLRLNGIDGSGETVDQYSQWGTWCHSYYYFVPPSEYFDAHPEYYSLYNGRRIYQHENGLEAQLCLTNPDVYEIVKTKLARELAANPEKIYWDFSVMDNSSVRGCECENCKALDEAAGSGMGSLLPFINKLAQDFPDIYISTLAYFHTIDAPVNGLKAQPNVLIKLCSMPGDQASSYADGANNNAAAFKNRVESWSKITDHLVIWDYVVNFEHLLLPFPNFAVQQANQKFYEDNHVVGIFHQASREQSDEFANLRAYVLAKLMWAGSSLDVNAVISKYLTVYYGAAAPYIAEYMQSASELLYRRGTKLGLYDLPEWHWFDYLSVFAVKKYEKLFLQAEAAVAGNVQLTDRVKEAKIPVLYAKMTEQSVDKKGRLAAGQEFFELAHKVGIQTISETKNPIDEYQAGFHTLVEESVLKIAMIIIGVSAGSAALVLLTVCMVRVARRKKKK